MTNDTGYALMESLSKLANGFNSVDSYLDLLTLIRAEFSQQLGFGSAWIYRYFPDYEGEEDLELIELSSDFHQHKSVPNLRSKDDPFLQAILASDQVVYVEDARTDPRTNKAIVEALQCRTLVNCRICSDGKIKGAIGTGSFGEQGVIKLSALQQKYVEAVAHILAVAIDRINYRETALRDPLTGLNNRRSFFEKAAQIFASAKRYQRHFSIIYLDLNDFKRINDKYGHEAGDKVLKAFASNIAACMRESDLVARLGGDEFVVLLSEINDQQNAETVKNKILNSCQPLVNCCGFTIDYSFSIGVAIYPEDAQTVDDLLAVADRHMYHNKNAEKVGGISA